MIMQSIEKKLRDAIKEAMIVKSKDNSTVNVEIYKTRKNILETAQKIAKEKQTDITDSMIYDAAKREIKQLADVLQYCGGKTEKQEIINKCVTEAETWLPEMTSEKEIVDFVEIYKRENKDNFNIGSVMKALKEKSQDNLDRKLASNIVKSMIK
jgi:uncharacterized protein YqeY